MFDFSFNLHNYSYSDPPLIESAPVSQVVLEGNNLTLHCNASGNPTPNITWTKEDSPSVLHQGITYSIVDIDRNAAGNYTCTAWNGVGGQKKATGLLSLYSVSFLALIYYISNHYSCEEKLSYINFIFMDVNNQLVSALSR